MVWLYSNNRVEEAERIIRNAAKLNNIAMPGSMLAARSLEIIVPSIKPAPAAATNGVTVQKVDNGAVLSNLERLKRAKEKAASIKKTRYTLLDLFRSFHLALYCVSMSFLWSVARFSVHEMFVFTVRRYALHGLIYRNSVRPSVCLSVCPSVCHTRALCPHGSTYDHDFFTIC